MTESDLKRLARVYVGLGARAGFLALEETRLWDRPAAEVHELGSRKVSSLLEVKPFPDGVVIFVGDYTGQIYVVVPASQVACDEATLMQLLQDLDSIAWDCNEGRGASLFFERVSLGQAIEGGLGGGLVTAKRWVHPGFRLMGLEQQIRDVLCGKRIRLFNAQFFGNDAVPWCAIRTRG